MRTSELSVGDRVLVTSGAYKGTEGDIEDLPDDCSVIRVQANAGLAYAYIGAVQKVIFPVRPSKRNPLQK